MPSASMADAIVLAVYMPPQEPGPGHGAAFDAVQLFSVDVAPVVFADRFEDGNDIDVSAVALARAEWCRHKRTPPGTFKRAMAMRQPGMFLSQPPMATMPSKPSRPTTVSMESAMTSRLDEGIVHAFSAPSTMASETVIVLKSRGTPPLPGAGLFHSGQIVDMHVARR